MEQEAAAFAARLEGLEVHLAHISKANEDLSDMVAQHQKIWRAWLVWLKCSRRAKQSVRRKARK